MRQFLFFAVIAAFSTALAAADTTSPEVRVATFSGSGTTGISDGPGASARYMMPFGLAYDKVGRLYVSDAAAQRIRVIELNGEVRTIAGGGEPVAGNLWVPGGFQNGAGARARFDYPAGLAVQDDGAVYVADANNHCIRRIDATANVTTYAGTCGKRGTADGLRLNGATFERPLGISADRLGNLYVADGFGVRIISSIGIVRTIPNFGSGPFGVSVVDTSEGAVIFATDILGIVRRTPDGTVQRFAVVGHLSAGNRNMQGIEPLGYPFAVAAFDENSVVFTDPRSNAVRYLNWVAGDIQTIGGTEALDGAASSGGFRNGSGDLSRFDAPVGAAVRRDGSIVIADAGNKRVRSISGLDRLHDAMPGLTPKKVAQKAYKVAFVGASFLWEYTRWSDSIEGIVENRLRQINPQILVIPYVFPGSPLEAQQEYSEFLGENGLANFVILNLNPLLLTGRSLPTPDDLENNPQEWQPALIKSLRSASRTLSSLGVGFLVCTNPLSEDISPTENIWNRLLESNAGHAPHKRLTEQINAAVRASGAPMLDLSEAFANDLRSANHAPLYGSEDSHFAIHGRAVFAAAVARYLIDLRPWRK